MTFRRLVNRVHLWLGLLTAVPVVFLSLTGTALVFETEIKRLENWRMAFVSPAGERLPYEELLARLRAARPDLTFNGVTVPTSPRHAVIGTTEAPPSPNDDAPSVEVFINPYTGEILGERLDDAGLMPVMRDLHTCFAAGETGELVATICTGVFACVLLSGFVLWLKRGGGWRKFMIARKASGRRLLYDLHAVVGAYSFVLLFVIAVSGTLIGIGVPWRDFILRVTGSEWRALPKLAVPVPEGEARGVTLDAALATAVRAFPDAYPDFISLPRKPEDPIRVGFEFAWTTTPYPRVSVHPLTGEVTDIDDPRRYDPGHLIHRINRGIHSGEFFGLFGDLLWFFASLVPALLGYTGYRLWKRPGAGGKAARAAAESGVANAMPGK